MAMITEKAYAKINLSLRVFPKREDGYHGIESLMQTVSLCDTVELVPTSAGISLTVLDCAELPENRTNLAYLAAEKFFLQATIKGGVDIRLHKHIPIAAGLAGGSADAAAVLRGLLELYPNAVTKDDILTVASALGSDVPFCLIGGSAICTGRGEIMTPTVMPKSYYVIASGGEKVSTKEAFAMLDRDAESLQYANVEIGFNAFEKVVLPLCTLAGKTKKRLLELGANQAMMSGSGSAVFGRFDSKDKAIHAAETLKREVPFAEYAESVGPLLPL